MTPLLLSLLCLWPSQPAPRADCYALISMETREEQHQWPVVISRDFVIRAPNDIGHIVGWPWPDIKRQCRSLDWSVMEFPVLQRGKPPFRFRLR